MHLPAHTCFLMSAQHRGTNHKDFLLHWFRDYAHSRSHFITLVLVFLKNIHFAGVCCFELHGSLIVPGSWIKGCIVFFNSGCCLFLPVTYSHSGCLPTTSAPPWVGVWMTSHSDIGMSNMAWLMYFNGKAKHLKNRLIFN